jgi:hypothetical protein
MALEVKSTYSGDGESILILKRSLPEGKLQIVIVGNNSQQQCYSIDPVEFLEGIRAVYPDLLIQLPS